MFKLENITYIDNGFKVLDNLSFEITDKEKAVILGVNGSGKSTLLKIMNGLIFPTSGALFYNNKLLDKEFFKNKKLNFQFRRYNLFLFQNYEAMLFNATVYDELAFGLREFNVDNIDSKVIECANKYDIAHLLSKSPLSISGGEKQRVALASLMIMNPNSILLDEPTSSFDPKRISWFSNLFEQLNICSVIATHNMALATSLTDRAIVLDGGKIVYDGNLEVLLNDIELLERTGLLFRHTHYHKKDEHCHFL